MGLLLGCGAADVSRMVSLPDATETRSLAFRAASGVAVVGYDDAILQVAVDSGRVVGTVRGLGGAPHFMRMGWDDRSVILHQETRLARVDLESHDIVKRCGLEQPARGLVMAGPVALTMDTQGGVAIDMRTCAQSRWYAPLEAGEWSIVLPWRAEAAVMRRDRPPRLMRVRLGEKPAAVPMGPRNGLALSNDVVGLPDGRLVSAILDRGEVALFEMGPPARVDILKVGPRPRGLAWSDAHGQLFVLTDAGLAAVELAGPRVATVGVQPRQASIRFLPFRLAR